MIRLTAELSRRLADYVQTLPPDARPEFYRRLGAAQTEGDLLALLSQEEG